ncbi:5' nucleotidase, NT5C type [Psychrobacillus sp. FSL K6-1464]|uniref:5' nucleotidase, NT5C type n=1 Tax=Psychrobacillus sp. FSL K6-1464 TaxID=2921545 RepID=UPI0030F50E28
MRKPIILLDMDDVMANFSAEWIRLYNEEYSDSLTQNDLTEWDASLFTKPECGMKIYDYLRNPGLFRNLIVADGCKDVLKDLTELGAEVIIVTDSPQGCSFGQSDWRGSNPTDDKRAWLQEHFPFIPKENFVVTSKKWLVQGDILIDDKPSTILKFQELGRKVVAMSRPCNQKIDAQLRADNWFVLHDILIQECFGGIVRN